MTDEKNLFEAGIAKTQIEAARRRLSINEKLEDLHEESISYLNESLIVLSLLIFLVSGALLFLYSNTSVLVLGLLIISASSIVIIAIKALRRRMRMRESRRRDLLKYDK